jgi:Fe-S cluster assembly ATPase SufC
VNKVHIVVDGEIVKSGSKELIDEVDSDGYTQYQGK